ncbi:MAG TPA: tRNA lysidine(34) synthetase TilS [Chlamydiales bacterium]|nr:tRNA lysidine(34) synthetase TilS [Chlamydiales bacterium]
MKDQCLKIVKEFLDRYLVDERPIILAISGGPDSLALLHLMRVCRQFFDMDLHIAHVDHSLRPESKQEALELKRYVEKLGLPFHIHTLDGAVEGNLEDWARQKRYRYFRALYQVLEAQALVVGHHLDDQAETVLKRVLEGAHLHKLGALTPESVFHRMRVWRPLLSLSKQELECWLYQFGAKGFDDATNRDNRYLRARMRQLIFPELEKQFGKKIAPTLARLGERSVELRSYLQRRTRRYFRAIEKTEQEHKIDLTLFYPLEKVEVMHFLSEWAASLDIMLSHSELETLFNLLKMRKAKREVGGFIIDRGVISIFRQIPAYVL